MLLGISAWWRFVPVDKTLPIHTWEQFHYVLTAEYFPEIRYNGLYQCAAAAVAAPAGDGVQAEKPFRDLHDNTYQTLSEQNRLHGNCRDRFSAERWDAWTRDVTWFHSKLGPSWDRIFFDHGCNASPLWLAIASQWTRGSNLTDSTLQWNSYLDAVLLLCLWILLVFTIGIGPTSIAAVLWGTNVLGGYEWTGGAFLRKDWFVLSGIAIAASSQGKNLLAGVIHGFAVLGRILPILPFAWILARRKRSESVRFGLGAVIALSIGIALPTIMYGVDIWPDFIANLRKHQATHGGNVVGLPRLIDNIALCRFGPYGQNEGGGCDLPEFKVESFESTAGRTVALLLGLTIAVLLFRRTSSMSLWENLALSALTIPLLVDVASYDTEYLAFSGLVTLNRPRLATVLLGTNLLVAIVSLGGLPGNSFYLVSSGILTLGVIFVIMHGEGGRGARESDALPGT